MVAVSSTACKITGRESSVLSDVLERKILFSSPSKRLIKLSKI